MTLASPHPHPSTIVLEALAAHTGLQPRRGTGHTYAARCPAHPDHSPSLSVTVQKDKVLLHCHSGCEPGDIMAALNLPLSALFTAPEKPTEGPGRGRVVAAYTYVDGDGTVLYEAVRMDPKAFRQRRPDGAGGWIWSIKDQKRVLYRLPEVRRAVADGDAVWIVEGEKDVHSLEQQGVTATCNPMGAGKWLEAYSQELAGADVKIVLDDDEPGWAHARTVAASVGRYAATVQVWKPLTGKDVTDHIEAGHSLSDLVPAAVDRAPSTEEPEILDDEGRRISLTPLSSIEVKRARWVWNTAPLDAAAYAQQGRLLAGAINLGVGPPGCGKSQHLIWLMARLSTGTLPGHFEGVPQNCAIAATEDSWNVVIVPRAMAAGANMDRISRIDVHESGPSRSRLTLPSDIGLLEHKITEEGVAFVALDPLLSVLDRTLDDYRAKDIRTALEPLAGMADRTGCTFYGLAHFRKSGGGNALEAIAGSGGLGQVVRLVNAYARDEDVMEAEGTRRFVMSTEKSNCGPTDIPSLQYTLEDVALDIGDGEGDLWTTAMRFSTSPAPRGVTDILRSAPLDDESREQLNDAAAWILDYLKDNGGVVEARAAQVDATSAQITPTMLKKARKVAGVQVKRPGVGKPVLWLHPYNTDGDTTSKVQVRVVADPLPEPNPSPSVREEAVENDEPPEPAGFAGFAGFNSAHSRVEDGDISLGIDGDRAETNPANPANPAPEPHVTDVTDVTKPLGLTGPIGVAVSVGAPANNEADVAEEADQNSHSGGPVEPEKIDPRWDLGDKIETVSKWLLEFLSIGKNSTMPVAAVELMAKKRGVATDVLHKARAASGVKVIKDPADGGMLWASPAARPVEPDTRPTPPPQSAAPDPNRASLWGPNQLQPGPSADQAPEAVPEVTQEQAEETVTQLLGAAPVSPPVPDKPERPSPDPKLPPAPWD